MALNPNALTDLDTAKSHLDIPSSNTSYDARVELFINAASGAIERYCDRSFVAADYTEFFHGRRQNMIMPRQFPIISVSEMRIACDRDFTAATSLIDSADYSIDDRENAIGYDTYFPTGRSNIRLMYRAGFENISTEAPELELACLWAVEWFYRHRGREDMGMTNMNKGDESVGILAIMPPMILELLMPFKRTEMPEIYSPVRNI